jgi:recombination DNA repair RAD52 pathway protein
MSAAGGDADRVYQDFVGRLGLEERRRLPKDAKTFRAYRDSIIANPAHRRKLGEIDQQAAHRIGETMVSGAYRLDQEQMQQDGANSRAQLDADTRQRVARIREDNPNNKETTQQATSRLRRLLAQNPDNDEAIEEYRSHLDAMWEKDSKEDPAISILKIRAITAEDPAVQDRAAKAFNKLRNEYYSRNGIFFNAPPRGTERQFPDGKIRKFKGGFRRDPADPKNWE